VFGSDGLAGHPRRPKFVALLLKDPLVLINKTDDIVPHPNLIHRLLTSLINAALTEGIFELRNDAWNRMREFKSVKDFAYAAAPMTAFIRRFCAPHCPNRFLNNFAEVIRHDFAGRKGPDGRRPDEAFEQANRVHQPGRRLCKQ
jgi:hypothetical protein